MEGGGVEWGTTKPDGLNDGSDHHGALRVAGRAWWVQELPGICSFGDEDDDSWGFVVA